MATNVDLPHRWLATLRTEGDRLAAMPPEYLDAPVPTLADWTLERVVRHVGKVHRWVTGLVTAPADADPDEVAAAAPSLPRGPACLTVYREALDEVVAALETADPARPYPSFVGPTQVAFWMRRQAHEVTVHRIDAADAVHVAGGPAPDAIDPLVAADGVAEWGEVFAGTIHSPAESLVGHSFGFTVTDGAPNGMPGSWRLAVDTEATTWSALEGRNEFGDVDVTIAGAAPELLLTLWHRRPLDAVTVTGDHARAVAMLDAMRF